MKPKQIKTLEELAQARAEKKSVHVPSSHCWGVRPAAFVMNQSGDVLLRMFQSGMFIYEKPKKKKGWKRPEPSIYTVSGTHPTQKPFSMKVYNWYSATILRRGMESVGYQTLIDPPRAQPSKK